VGKILEGILANRLTERAEEEKWFSKEIGGFRPGRRTTDQLISFSHKVSECLRQGKVCATAFLDVSSAYDRVFRPGLIAKIARFGLRGRLLRWLVDFLKERSARVRFDGERSRVIPHEYGLPQGSRLSPVLFNIFMSDMLPDSVLTGNTDAGVYADDVRISAFGDTRRSLKGVKLDCSMGSKKPSTVRRY